MGRHVLDITYHSHIIHTLLLLYLTRIDPRFGRLIIHIMLELYGYST